MSTTILNARTKKVWKPIEGTTYKVRCSILFLWSESWIHFLNSNLLWFVSLTDTWYQKSLRTPLLFPFSLYSTRAWQLAGHNWLFVTNLIFIKLSWRWVAKDYQTKISLPDRSPKTFFNASNFLFSDNLRNGPDDLSCLYSPFFLILVSCCFLCPGNFKQLRFSDQILKCKQFCLLW